MNDFEKQKKRIEKVKKFYTELNQKPDELKKYFRNKIIAILADSEKSTYCIYDAISKNVDSKNMHIIDELISEMVKLNYINNQRYAVSYIKGKAYGNNGKTKIVYGLKNKKFKDSEINAAFSEIENEIDFYEICKNYAKRKYKDKLSTKDMKEKSKIVNHLTGKGFNLDQIKEAMSIDFDIE